jgi:hypothetical protein
MCFLFAEVHVGTRGFYANERTIVLQGWRSMFMGEDYGLLTHDAARRSSSPCPVGGGGAGTSTNSAERDLARLVICKLGRNDRVSGALQIAMRPDKNKQAAQE